MLNLSIMSKKTDSGGARMQILDPNVDVTLLLSEVRKLIHRQGIATLLLLILPFLAHADDYVEWVGANSGVNWTSGSVQSEGAGVGPSGRPAQIAKLMACRAAVVDAQRNLLESIQGVRVVSDTVVSNMMVESDIIRTSVDGLLKGAQVVKRQPMDDGSCLVEMTAPLGGSFASNVYKEVLTEDEASQTSIPGDYIISGLKLALNWLISPVRAEESVQVEWQRAMDALAARISSLEDLLSRNPRVLKAEDKMPTGLVLDSRGSNFIPSMSPRIRVLRGGIIYPNAQHGSSFKDHGQLVSLFTRDLNTATRHPRVGERPIVLKALRTFGSTRTEIVLGKESSAELVALIDKGFLDDAGVIIVL